MSQPHSTRDLSHAGPLARADLAGDSLRQYQTGAGLCTAASAGTLPAHSKAKAAMRKGRGNSMKAIYRPYGGIMQKWLAR